MLSNSQDTFKVKLRSLRDTALTLLIAGGAQVLLALILWPILFRREPLGFSLALSLIGFGNWIVSALSSFGFGRRNRQNLGAIPATQQPPLPLIARMQEQTDRAGCGFLLFLSSFVPLAMAFMIRVRADLKSGLTWQQLFPPLP